MKTTMKDFLTGRITPTTVTKIHFLKLVIRSFIFIAFITVYLTDKNIILNNIYRFENNGAYLLIFIWIFFVTEMLFRFFPSKYESMGCQKQFARNFIQNENCLTPINASKRRHLKSIVIVALSWIILNSGIAALFFTGIIDEAALLIISLFFAMCDLICILFYCPFQSLIMKNRCCLVCRIYNWDYLMMFTPLVFIKSYFTLSLFTIALLLFIRWELVYYQHPERMFEETNQRLSCFACTEKLCIHKKGPVNNKGQT